MTQSERIKELENRIVELELVVEQLKNEAKPCIHIHHHYPPQGQIILPPFTDENNEDDNPFGNPHFGGPGGF